MKIPFERTIAGAYRFAFTNILSIIGIGWFPFLLLGVVVGGLIYLWMPQFTAFGAMISAATAAGPAYKPPPFDQTRAVALVGAAIGSYLLAFLTLMVVQAMVNVGLMRKALGQYPGPVFFFFSLGSQVWRLIGSYLLLFLLFIGGVTLIVGAIAAISVGLSQVSGPWQWLVTFFLGLFAVLGFIYAFVRLSFFIPAVVVAENHIGLRRSWHLGGGNFWRILGIILIVTLPLSMAVNTVTSSMLQMAMGPQMGNMAAATPAESQKIFMTMLHTIGQLWPYYLALQFVNFILQAGLTAGAAANAYNLVTGGSEIAPRPAKVMA
ncbi:MAG TPA: hypothetical protein VHZ78_09950 [Rhizomicrobium sp.]|jgi:hypothetical protein|nr:hypothetical protein [Rhizomicrobium sp.]